MSESIRKSKMETEHKCNIAYQRREEPSMVDGMANPVMMGGGSSEDRDNTDGGVSSVESHSNQNTISKSDLNNGAAPNMFLPLAGAKRGDTVSR